MKTGKILGLLAGAVLLFFSCDPFDLQKAAGVQEITVSVTQDRYVLFEEFSADWESDLPVGDVRWELRKGGELVEVIEEGWSVHEGIGSGTDYRLRIVSEESDQVYGESEEFAILTYLLLGGNGDDWGDALELDGDGNIYIAGRSGSNNIGGSGQSNGEGAVVIKLNWLGAPDITFSGDGQVYIEPTSLSFDQPADLVLLPDGRIFVSGGAVGSSYEAVAYMLDAQGSADTGFDGDGERIFLGEGHDVIHKAILHPDGDKILTCGRFNSNTGDYEGEQPNASSAMEAFVQLLSLDGSYNSQFAKMGIADLAGISTLGGPGNEWFNDLVTVPDGSGGYLTTIFGSLDNDTIEWVPGKNQGGMGPTTTDILISGYQNDGKYRSNLLGWCGSKGSLAYGGSGTDMLASGVYDGTAYWACGYSNSTDFEGSLSTQGSYDILLVRFNAADGSLDTANMFMFGGTESDIAKKMVQMGDSLYLTGSFSSDDFDPDGDGTPLENRYSADGFILCFDADTGALNTSFGEKGTISTGGNAYDLLNDIVVDADGTLYCLGTSTSPDIPGQNLKGGKDIFLVVMKP